MRLQSRSTTKYVITNFWYLMPLVLPAAVLLAIFQPTFGPTYFFAHLFDLVSDTTTVNFENFYDSLYRFFSFINVEDFLFWLIAFVASLISLCVVYYFIQKHIRFGTKSYSKIFRGINEMFLYVVPFVVIAVGCYEIWMLLLSGCILLFSVLLKGMTFYVSAVILTVSFYILYFIALGLAILAPPSMFFDGYNFTFSIGYSFHLAGLHFKEMVLGVLLKVFVFELLFLSINYLITFVTDGMLTSILYYLLKLLSYLWWLIYLPCISCCKYVDFTEMSRADLKLRLF